MTCKNCGATLSDNAKVCQNCGAFVDDGDGYILLSDNDIMKDVYSERKKRKKKKGGGIIGFLCALLTLAIIGGGAFYYFTKIYKPVPDKPTLLFETGSGVINDDEKIIYVLLPEGSQIEFIHGVSLFNCDKTLKENQNAVAISTDYEYTKSIDSSFRAIFFYADKLEIPEGDNTYTFEMNFSFFNSEDVFTYTQPITFNSQIDKDASDLIFDHSQQDNNPEQSAQADDSENKPEKETTEKETTASSADYEFIYNSYWYTEPIQNGDEYIISAIRFNKDKTYVTTNYYKEGSKDWEITTHNGKFNIQNGFAVIDNGEATESTYYKIDASKKTLYEENEDESIISTLTSRKYNSVQNAEDFFGI